MIAVRKVYYEGKAHQEVTEELNRPLGRLRLSQNEDCVCLSVLDTPIKFTGWLHRLLNPFMAWR